MNVCFKKSKTSRVMRIGGRDTVNQMPRYLASQSCSLTLEECLQEAEPQFSNRRAKANTVIYQWEVAEGGSIIRGEEHSRAKLSGPAFFHFVNGHAGAAIYYLGQPREASENECPNDIKQTFFKKRHNKRVFREWLVSIFQTYRVIHIKSKSKIAEWNIKYLGKKIKDLSVSCIIRLMNTYFSDRFWKDRYILFWRSAFKELLEFES